MHNEFAVRFPEVFDHAEPPEFVHEKVHPHTRGADHLCQRLLAEAGQCRRQRAVAVGVAPLRGAAFCRREFPPARAIGRNFPR